MPYVVAEPCIKCKYTDCVEVCPVDCFHEGPNFLVINPDECIDCGACVPECPTEAIFLDEDLPAKWENYIDLNAVLSAKWPEIVEQKDPLPEADEFKAVEDGVGTTGFELLRQPLCPTDGQRGETVEIGVDGIEGAPCRQQCCGGLCANPRHTDHSIGAVPDERLEVDDLRGLHPQTRHHSRFVDVPALLGCDDPDIRSGVADQLEEVFVRCLDAHRKPGSDRVCGQGGGQIIGLDLQ